MALTLVRAEVAPGVQELTVRANEAHQACTRHLEGALTWALAAGEALCELRRLVPSENWRAWAARNLSITPQAAYSYQRLWSYREALPEGTASVNGALKKLKGLPAVASGSWRNCRTPGLMDQCLSLHAQGLGYKAISQRTGVPLTTIQGWVNPEVAVRRRAAARQRAADAAAAQRDEAADRLRRARNSQFAMVGGELAAAYRSLRNSSSLIQILEDRSVGPLRLGMAEAAAHLRKAEEVLARASRRPQARR